VSQKVSQLYTTRFGKTFTAAGSAPGCKAKRIYVSYTATSMARRIANLRNCWDGLQYRPYSSYPPSMLRAFPSILKLADEGLFFCFGQALIKPADLLAVTFECCPRGVVGLIGQPHWPVGHRGIGAAAHPEDKQNDKDVMGCSQRHRQDAGAVRTKAPRIIFGSLIEALSDLALAWHSAP
jgi:hypothetical protein